MAAYQCRYGHINGVLDVLGATVTEHNTETIKFPLDAEVIDRIEFTPIDLCPFVRVRSRTVHKLAVRCPVDACEQSCLGWDRTL